MATVTDLRRILDEKGLIIIIAVNLLNDIISISTFLSLKEETITQSGLYYLFDRYFCTDISVLSFARFISFYGLILFYIVNRIREDNQKYGIFYLVRLSRLKYVLGKISSSIIFIFFICSFTAFQSFLCHRLANIDVPVSQYVLVTELSFIICFSAAQTALLVYSNLKSSSVSFLCAFAVLIAISVTFSLKSLVIPTEDNISIEYTYPLILAAVLTVFIFPIMLTRDFITTKIKE